MRPLLPAAAMVLLAACPDGDLLTAGTRDVVVRPERGEYDRPAVGELVVSFTVTNHTDDSITIAMCGSGSAYADVERLEDDDWEIVSPGFCVGSVPPLQLAPDSTAAGAVYAPGPAGTFRLRVPYGVHQSLRHGVSAPFQVR